MPSSGSPTPAAAARAIEPLCHSLLRASSWVAPVPLGQGEPDACSDQRAAAESHLRSQDGELRLSRCSRVAPPHAATPSATPRPTPRRAPTSAPVFTDVPRVQTVSTEVAGTRIGCASDDPTSLGGPAIEQNGPRSDRFPSPPDAPTGCRQDSGKPPAAPPHREGLGRGRMAQRQSSWKGRRRARSGAWGPLGWGCRDHVLAP